MIVFNSTIPLYYNSSEEEEEQDPDLITGLREHDSPPRTQIEGSSLFTAPPPLLTLTYYE